MLSNTITALVITCIGMALVFLAILVLWAGMALLVHFSADHSEDPEANFFEKKSSPSNDTLAAQKQKAAAAAVVIALEQQANLNIHILPLPPTAIVSAWQAVMRSSNFSSRRQNK